MNDYQKVMTGLECLTHVNFAIYKTECQERNCPYKDTDCEIAVMVDAYNILTPRIMALEELSSRMTGWLEYEGEVLPVIGGSSTPGAHCFIDALDRSLALKDADYDVVWRVWTMEPSDIQRAREGRIMRRNGDG